MSFFLPPPYTIYYVCMWRHRVVSFFNEARRRRRRRRNAAVSFSLPDVVVAAAVVDAAFFPLLFVKPLFLLAFLLAAVVVVVVVVVVADVLQRRAEYVLVLQNDSVFDVFYFLSHDAGAAKDLEPINAREFQVARREGTMRRNSWLISRATAQRSDQATQYWSCAQSFSDRDVGILVLARVLSSPSLSSPSPLFGTRSFPAKKNGVFLLVRRRVSGCFRGR